MRKTIVAVALCLLAGAASADPVDGLWQTEAGDGGGYLFVRIAPCGAAICGVIERGVRNDGTLATTAAEYGNIGKTMLWDMRPQGDGGYRGGRIWDPDRDKTYNGKMALDGDRLRVEGCVLGICRGQTWARVE